MGTIPATAAIDEYGVPRVGLLRVGVPRVEEGVDPLQTRAPSMAALIDAVAAGKRGAV